MLQPLGNNAAAATPLIEKVSAAARVEICHKRDMVIAKGLLGKTAPYLAIRKSDRNGCC
ncbi:hypothetical protein ACVDG8_014580 [Mesorhizobium sp. ORM8.1]